MLTAKQVLKRLIKEVNDDNLVLDWMHMSEAQDGSLAYNYNACRFCIIGHVNRYRSQVSDSQLRLLDNLIHRSKIGYYSKHTPNQVKTIFTRWLKKLEKY